VCTHHHHHAHHHHAGRLWLGKLLGALLGDCLGDCLAGIAWSIAWGISWAIAWSIAWSIAWRRMLGAHRRPMLGHQSRDAWAIAAPENVRRTPRGDIRACVDTRALVGNLVLCPNYPGHN
jgi:hypothetical protein